MARKHLKLVSLAAAAVAAAALAPVADAITTSAGQAWDYVPDAWARANDADTSYFGWDNIELANTTLGMGRVLDDSTPDLGAVGTPAQRIFQGTSGAIDPLPTAYGHRSGSGNYYSGFGAADIANDTITGVAASSGSGGFTTLVLQLIAGAPSGMGANALTGMSFSLGAPWTKQKDLYGTQANGTGVYWQEWTAPGADLPFQIAIGSAESSRSIDAFTVDARWSPTLLTNARSAIGVPEPSTAILGIVGAALATAWSRRRIAAARG